MRKTILFTLTLLTGVAIALSSLTAQEPQDPQEPRDRRAAPRVFSFDTRGVQLGVTISDLESRDLGGRVAGGVRIDEVAPDSAAAKAGLQAGDIVTTFDGERVRSARQFSRLVQETPEGRTVGVDIVRDGQVQSLQVTPERRAATMRFDGEEWPGAMAFRFEDIEPRLREIEPRLREMEPLLREQLRELEPRLGERDGDIRERLDAIERMLKQLLEKQ